MRSLKQKFQFERGFRNKGALASMLSQLSGVISAQSTRPTEALTLTIAYTEISKTLSLWDAGKDQAWEYFNARNIK